jgi:hypothetical protein
MEPEHIAHGNEPAGHETEDASVHGIVLTGVGVAIGAALIGLIVYGIFQYLAHNPVTTAPVNPMAETDRQQLPPAPRIEEHPSLEVKDLHEMEDSILSTHGWTDKSAGVVRIPIDRAMELQLQRGFPARKGAKQK